MVILINAINLYKLISSFVIISEFAQIIFCEEDNILDQGRNEEYCNGETFMPTCNYGEVVVVKKAHFGRMNIGRCLTEEELQVYGIQKSNPKVYGCYKDVISYMNEKCTMKNTCEVKITELDKLAQATCHSGLRLHLNVTHSCLKVINVDDRCEISASNDLKYLDPSQISNSRCVSGRKSLSIEAPRGQNIKMSLELFHQLEKNKEEMEENEVMCDKMLGIIKQENNRENVTICSNGFARDKESIVKDSFISQTDFIQIFLTLKLPKNNLFLLKIETVGCRDIIQPEDMWMQRNGDEMVIGCFMTKQKWYLSCQDRVWSGVIGNCSNSVSNAGGTNKEKIEPSYQSKVDISKKQQILIIVSICGLGIVACVTIICTGFICLKRCNMKHRKNLPIYYASPPNIQTTMHLQPQQQQPDFMNSAVQYNANMQPMQQSMKYNTIHDNCEEGQHLKEEDRYQVLDQEEVAKETLVLL